MVGLGSSCLGPVLSTWGCARDISRVPRGAAEVWGTMRSCVPEPWALGRLLLPRGSAEAPGVRAAEQTQLPAKAPAQTGVFFPILLVLLTTSPMSCAQGQAGTQRTRSGSRELQRRLAPFNPQNSPDPVPPISLLPLCYGQR